MQYKRDEYLNALKKQVQDNIYYHSLALEACMGGIYDYLQSKGSLGKNELSREEWMFAALIHDIDYSGEFKKDHPKKTKDALDKYGLPLPEDIDKIIKAHAPEITGVQPKSKAQWAIFCADSLTGLITAVTLVYPSKKLKDVKLKSVIKKFKKAPNFASGTRRDSIAMCERIDGLNIPLDKFIEICLNSMKSIAQEIGL